MGTPILLLRLESPLQSWGTRSRWDVRDTATEPTKSGIIGLLGCGLGYSMRDPRLEALDASLQFGVRVENPGRIIADFQTITGFLPTAGGEFRFSGGTGKGPPDKLVAENKEPATILSPRTYIEDGAFLVALASLDVGGALLSDCADAVQKPRWPLFLGRKACVPTRPIFDKFTSEYASLEDALRSCPWSWLGHRTKARQTNNPPLQLNVFLEQLPGTQGPNVSVRQEAMRTNSARLYGFCSFKRVQVPFPNSTGVVDPSPATTDQS